ncbi:MAG: DNA methylase [Lachnospiraceae bacterium]|nr:DNA methylase [Lachnospiraceae bacterium]
MKSSAKKRVYAAIDLKSFYASCECVDMGLDPLTTNLVVADASRTNKTICLAVSPALKSFGIPGRPRLFEVEQRVREVNAQRLLHAPGKAFTGSFTDIGQKENSALALDYIVATPRMAVYMDTSKKIYGIYLKHVAPEDIFAYSVDEVFIDLTSYLDLYKISAHELVIRMVRNVLDETGITATAGIGTNMFLAKVAMDIVAKHAEPDADGVRIAQLDERSYRELLWAHTPITDIWRVGKGTAKKLADYGIYTMGDIARASLSRDRYRGEPLLYRLMGVNAELLIDHAWGYEPCTLADVKGYIPENTSLSSGQVLQRPYAYGETRLITQEMTDLLVLELVEKGLVCDSVALTIGYDAVNLSDPVRGAKYKGQITTDRYDRRIPKHAHGSESLDGFTSSTARIMDAMLRIFDRVVDPDLLARYVTVAAVNTRRESEVPSPADPPQYEQLDLFTDYAAIENERQKQKRAEEKERNVQMAVLEIRKKYGKNAILKGMNLQEGAMTIERNKQVGGHKA